MDEEIFAQELAWSYDGDLQIYNNDVRIATGADAVRRMALRWILQGKGTWDLYPYIGTNLDSYLGIIQSDTMLELVTEEMSLDINRNNYFRGTTLSFEITSAYTNYIFSSVYVKTPDSSIKLADVDILCDNIYTRIEDPDPYDPLPYFPDNYTSTIKYTTPSY